MVERPIKKSDRKSEDTADTGLSNSDSKAPVQPKSKGLGKNDKRSSDRGKKAYESGESKQLVNPALERGPKPVKTPAPITPEPETEAELFSQEPQAQEEQLAST